MANPIARFGTFLAGVREEMTHVTWPGREELISSALVVFVGVTMLATFISIVDYALSHAARLLLR